MAVEWLRSPDTILEPGLFSYWTLETEEGDWQGWQSLVNRNQRFRTRSTEPPSHPYLLSPGLLGLGLPICEVGSLLGHCQVAVQSLGRVCLFATLPTAAHQASLSFTIYQSLLKLTSFELTMPSNHLIPSLAPFSSCLQTFPASDFSIRVTLMESER